MLIELVKVNNDKSIVVEGKFILEQREESEDQYLSIKIKSNRPAHSAFYESLAKLKPHILQMCEMPKDELNRITCTGASFTRTKKEDIFGAIITGKRRLQASEDQLAVNTPHRTETPYQDGDKSPLLTQDCIEALQDLIVQAEMYVSGYNEQLNMLNGTNG